MGKPKKRQPTPDELRATADLLSTPAGGERVVVPDGAGGFLSKRATPEELCRVLGERGRMAGWAQSEISHVAERQSGKLESDAAKAKKKGDLPERVKAAWRASGLTGASCFLKSKLHPKLRALLNEAGVQAERVKGDAYRFYTKKPPHEWPVKLSSLKGVYFARKGPWAQESESQSD